LINATKIFLDKPLLNQTIVTIEPRVPVPIAGTFTVTPYLVDHSSPEAFAFLVEADGKRIFYSGDFRATGNKKICYKKLIERPPRNIDVLFLEGTMVERDNSKYPDEETVKNAICAIVKKQENVTFVASSAQNIDRFVSVVKACIIAEKQVVVDVYNAWVLEMVHKKSPNLPTTAWEQVLVFKHPNQMEKMQSVEFDDFRSRIEPKSVGNKVFENPKGFVYFLRCPSTKLVNALKSRRKINLIYSQWEGYLRPEHKTYFTDIINNLKKDPDICFSAIHTSGHATLHELKELATAIHPQLIVPIHTDNPDKFQQEFIKSGFQNVDIWIDNQSYPI
jgi:ribonuclease J